MTIRTYFNEIMKMEIEGLDFCPICKKAIYNNFELVDGKTFHRTCFYDDVNTDIIKTDTRNNDENVIVCITFENFSDVDIDSSDKEWIHSIVNTFRITRKFSKQLLLKIIYLMKEDSDVYISVVEKEKE
jgi:hypothetical protein